MCWIELFCLVDYSLFVMLLYSLMKVLLFFVKWLLVWWIVVLFLLLELFFFILLFLLLLLFVDLCDMLNFFLVVFKVFIKLVILFLWLYSIVKNFICFFVFFRLKVFFLLLNGSVLSFFSLVESLNLLVNWLRIVFVLVRVVLFFNERGNMWILVLIVDIFVLVMFLILGMLILIFCWVL